MKKIIQILNQEYRAHGTVSDPKNKAENKCTEIYNTSGYAEVSWVEEKIAEEKREQQSRGEDSRGEERTAEDSRVEERTAEEREREKKWTKYKKNIDKDEWSV